MSADGDPNVRQTAEWTVLDGDPRLDRLIEYGRKLGLPEPFRDSFDLRDVPEETL